MIATTTDIFRFGAQLLLEVLKPAYRQPAINLGGGIGGTIKSMLNSLFDETIGKLVDWVGKGLDIRNYTILDDPGKLDAAQNAWGHSLEISFLLFPTFIILGMLSMPFAERQKTRLWRQGLRIVGVVALIAVSKPAIGFGIEMSNILTMTFMPSTEKILKVLSPGAPIAAAAAAILTPFGAIMIGGIAAAIVIGSMGIIVILLQFRQFFINVVFIASPILAVFWYIDWGLLEGVNEFAAKWGRMGLFTILSGPIIGIIFRAAVVTFEQGLATADKGLASLISSMILMAIVPLLLIAATWKMVSWAGEPVGASQAMTGAIMGAAALTGVGMEQVMGEAGEGMGSAAQQAGSQATGGSGGGSGSGSGGTASAPAGAGGQPSGDGTTGGSPGTSSESSLAQDLSEGEEQATVEASSSEGAESQIGVDSPDSSSGGTATAGSHNEESPATGTSEGGPSDSVTGAGSSSGDSEPQSYIDAGREAYSNGKERMQTALDNAHSKYSDKAKDSLNPTNALRGRAQQERAKAEGVENKLNDFNNAVDTQEGAVDLEQAHESGALGATPKAVEEGGDTEVELGEDGTFEYEDANGNEVSQNVGATRQQLRKGKNDHLEEASNFENKADKIDSKLSEHGERLNKTREQLGKGAYKTLKEGASEAIRGTVGAHSPYLQTNRPGGSRGNIPNGQSGGGRTGDEAESQASSGEPSSSGRPRANATAEQVSEHSDTVTESNERFDLRDRYGNNGVYRTDTGPSREGISQAGYIEDPESGETITQVEVAEDSDVTLTEEEEVELGNVTAVQRDGSHERSHSKKSEEYESVVVDEQSRAFDENETRPDEIIGESDAVGETVKTKSGTIRRDSNDENSEDHLFRQEFSDGSVVPVRAPNEESAEALQEVEGQEVDLVADVQQKYGNEPETHDGYEGAHEYNELTFDITDSSGDGSTGEEASASGGGGSRRNAKQSSNSQSGEQVNAGSSGGESAEQVVSEEGEEVETAESADESGEDIESAEGKEGNENHASGWGMTSGVGMPDAYTAEKYEDEAEPASRFQPDSEEEEASEAEAEDVDHYVQPVDGMDSTAGGKIGGSGSEEDTGTRESPKASSSSSGVEHKVIPASGRESEEGESSHGGTTERVEASELTSEFVHRDDESGRVTVELPEDARYQYVPERGGLADEMKSKGYFELENGDELEEDAPELIGGVAFNGEDDYPPDGDWGFEKGEPRVIEGGELNDVNTKVWGVGRPHEHERGREMANAHAGGPDEYIQIRPTDETDLSQNQVSGEEVEEESPSASPVGPTSETSAGGEAVSGEEVEEESPATSPVGPTSEASEEGEAVSERQRAHGAETGGDSQSSPDDNIVPQSPGANPTESEDIPPHSEVEESEEVSESGTANSEAGAGDFVPQEPQQPAGPPGGIESHDELAGDDHEPEDRPHSEEPDDVDVDSEDVSGDNVTTSFEPGEDETGEEVTFDEDGESESGKSWEEVAENWRDHVVESAEPPEIDSGSSEDAMQAEVLESGEVVYITDYDELGDDADADFVNPDVAEDLRHRSLAGHKWTEIAGDDPPNVAYNEEENEIIQQEGGGLDTETWEVESAPEEVLEDVDEEEFREKMATQLVAGNGDLHAENVHVTENSEVELIDFDRIGGDTGDYEDYNHAVATAFPAAQTAETIGEVNDEFPDDAMEYEDELAETAVEKARELREEYGEDELLGPIRELDEQHGTEKDVAPVIENNLSVLTEAEVSETSED